MSIGASTGWNERGKAAESFDDIFSKRWDNQCQHINISISGKAVERWLFVQCDPWSKTNFVIKSTHDFMTCHHLNSFNSQKMTREHSKTHSACFQHFLFGKRHVHNLVYQCSQNHIKIYQCQHHVNDWIDYKHI